MRVNVCFGSTNVIVPCREEIKHVRDLFQPAITRYKKATKKSSNSWVTVQSLEIDGDILDPDDIFCDVVYDMERLVAIYDEYDSISPHQHGSEDGVSVTSAA